MFSDLIKQFYEVKSDALKVLDLKLSHLKILHLLSDHNGINQQEIAVISASKRSTISEIISEMESEDLVMRIGNDKDRRVMTVSYTHLDVYKRQGTNIKEAIAAMPLNPEFKKKDLSNVIAEVFNRYRTEGTSDIMDNIKDLGFEYSTVAGMTVSLADINVVPNKQKYVEEGRAQADKLDKLLSRGMLTPPEWERHFSKLWADKMCIRDRNGTGR